MYIYIFVESISVQLGSCHRLPIGPITLVTEIHNCEWSDQAVDAFEELGKKLELMNII